MDVPVMNMPAGITVTGVGTAAGAPDLLRLSLGVEATAVGLADAHRRAAEAATRLLAALAEAGIGPGDTATSVISLRPETSWHDGGRQETTGYTASTTFNVTVRNLQHAPAVLEAAVAAAADSLRLGGTGFGFSEPEILATAARAAAWQDARTKAGQLAALAGRSLGPVLRIEENGAGGPVPLPAMRESSLLAADLPVVPGTAELSARLTVTWGWAEDGR
ncbi:SIMPL domain-containing protein [Arthrobacter sp. I2-34]|uniref:SIMPL domain-containing protein n=1 Tax=Arthrobacter hankyongi TaxID=2904801 RepID=A0ABS9L0V5_9MICC|nr:SIMPL domain-containing protein [Arthrobacter hankyongi]MCG2620310.1 SIMPL domain-containing protein [Arthrobacter hankyongi]